MSAPIGSPATKSAADTPAPGAGTSKAAKKRQAAARKSKVEE